MCKFKSGIILKNKIVLTPLTNESHSNLLNTLGIEDNYKNASSMFIRAELLPSNNQWWINPKNWIFNVDQDILPDWFTEDKGKYEDEFRSAVIDFYNKHILVDKEINELSEGIYWLYNSNVNYLTKNTIIINMNNSTVQGMYDDSIVKGMYGNSIVKGMYDNSTVQEMYGNSIARCSYNQTIYISSNCDYVIKTK